MRPHSNRRRSPGLRITWLGHSSLLMEIGGLRVLVDPVWDARASPLTSVGPKRFFDPPLAISDLPRIDVVLHSHDHFDHLGQRTVQQLANSAAASSAQWVTSLGVGQCLRKFGVTAKIDELNWTDSITVADSITITAVPTCHFSGRGIANRFHTLWSSFVIKSREHNVYFGADSGLWDGFAEIGRSYGPFDLTMLEIGAYNDLWKSIHMGPDGAAKAFEDMGRAGLLMPIHWGLFDLALHAWYQPIERLTDIADHEGLKLWSPEPGLPTDVMASQEHRSEWWKKFR